MRERASRRVAPASRPYIPYLHFVERLDLDASTPVAHGAEEGTHDVRMKPGAAAEHKH